jgi:hypothetical protein
MKARGIVCVRSIAPPDVSMSGFHSGREEQGERPTSAVEKRNIRPWLQFLDERQVAAVCTRLACEQAQIVQIENTILASEYISLALKHRRNVIRSACCRFRVKTAAPWEMRSRGEVQEFVRYESYECLEEPFEMKAARGT